MLGFHHMVCGDEETRVARASPVRVKSGIDICLADCGSNHRKTIASRCNYLPVDISLPARYVDSWCSGHGLASEYVPDGPLRIRSFDFLISDPHMPSSHHVTPASAYD